MQVSVQIDHAYGDKMVTNTLSIELPEGKAWANVKDFSVDAYYMDLGFDDGGTKQVDYNDRDVDISNGGWQRRGT
jgi:hypothetical protein